MNTNTEVPQLLSHPFLLLRLVAFIILTLLNILTLSFAAFNITASRIWEQFVSTGPSLAVFNSSLFLFLSMLLVGERKFSHAIPPVSMVLVEICWTSVMTVLAFVSSVLSTQQGPAKMCSSIPVNLAMCSSSILILPVSWMNFFIFLGYSVTLLIVTVLHAPLVPGVWHSNVSEIPWFASSVSRITRDSFPSDKPDLERQTVYGDAFRSVHGDDQQEKPIVPPRPPWLTLPRGSLTISVASFTPAWAKQYNIGLTRGLHNPFGKSPGDDSTDHQTLHFPSEPVQRPARVITKPVHEDRLHDDDPFASPNKLNTVTTSVPDEYDEMKLPLHSLSGFTNFLRWSDGTTPGGIDSQDQDTGKRGIGMLMLRNPSNRTSHTTATTATVVPLTPHTRKSVSSLFPHDVREEDWNLPLTKPPFRNGRGEGWATADATQDVVPAGWGRGRR